MPPERLSVLQVGSGDLQPSIETAPQHLPVHKIQTELPCGCLDVRERMSTKASRSCTQECGIAGGDRQGARETISAVTPIPTVYSCKSPNRRTGIIGCADPIVTFNQRDFVSGRKGLGCAVILPATALQQIRSLTP